MDTPRPIARPVDADCLTPDPIHTTGCRFNGWLLAVLAWLGGAHLAFAQNPCCMIIEPTDTNTTVMRSGGLFALQTRTRPIYFDAVPGVCSISFGIGFATDEVPGEGEIFDSVSLVLQNTNTGVTAMLLTADANGFSWLPPTPGLLPILESALDHSPTTFPDLPSLPARSAAYQVTLSVPAALAAGWSDVTLVLYDYPNGLNSVGWLGAVTVIPPPGVLEVSPTDRFRSLGPPGGSLVPVSQTYTLTNSGGSTLTWRAVSSANWLSVSEPNGTLDLGRTTNVTVTINSRAQALGPGIYTAQVTFTNLTLQTNSVTCPVQLAVAVPPVLKAVPSPVAGEFRLQLRAAPAAQYRIEASRDFVSWLPVQTNTTGLDGLYQFVEPAPLSRRFYRASFVTP